MPIASSSSCTVPSSPSRPCSAMNATSGARRAARATSSGPTSIAITSWPSRCSASCDLGAGAQRDRALQRAPALQDGDRARRRSSILPLRRAAPGRLAARQLDDVGQRRASGSVGCGRRARRPRLRRRPAAGQRAEQPELLARSPGRCAGCPRGCPPRGRRRSSGASRRRRAAVHVGGAAGHERDALARAPARAGRSCRCARRASPR